MKKEEALIVIENLRKEKELIIDNDLSKQISSCMSEIYAMSILIRYLSQPKMVSGYFSLIARYFNIDSIRLSISTLSNIQKNIINGGVSISDIIDIIIDNIEKLVKED